MKNALAFAAVAEATTGLALLIVPSLVGNCCSVSNLPASRYLWRAWLALP
jgi:hypothetical protein